MTPIQHNGIPRASKISNQFPHYSKSMSHKNSKNLDIVFVQVTQIVPKRHNLSFMLQKIQKITSIQHNGIARASEISN